MHQHSLRNQPTLSPYLLGSSPRLGDPGEEGVLGFTHEVYGHAFVSHQHADDIVYLVALLGPSRLGHRFLDHR